MSRPVLVTRAGPGASRTCARLNALGYRAVNAATARIVFFEADLALQPGETLALTSPNGALAAARLTPARDLPVFTVGDASAAAAREAGFTQVTSAAGDGEALAALLISAGDSPVVHVRGRDQGFDLGAALTRAGREARAVIAYAAEPVEALAPAALEALEAGAVILAHSARGAARLVARVSAADRAALIRGAGAAAISAAAAAPLEAAGAAPVEIAETPDEDHLFAALSRLLR